MLSKKWKREMYLETRLAVRFMDNFDQEWTMVTERIRNSSINLAKIRIVPEGGESCVK